MLSPGRSSIPSCAPPHRAGGRRPRSPGRPCAAVAFASRDTGTKHRIAERGPIPVARHHEPAHPDLAHTARAGCSIDVEASTISASIASSSTSPAATNSTVSCASTGSSMRSPGLTPADSRSGTWQARLDLPARTNEQGRLRQPIRRHHRLRVHPQTRRPRRSRKRKSRCALAPAVDGHFEAARIERLSSPACDTLSMQRIREVRRARDLRAMVRHGLEQRYGRIRNAAGANCTQCRPCRPASRCRRSGRSHDAAAATRRRCRPAPAHTPRPCAALASRFAWLTITPFGSAVEPEVCWEGDVLDDTRAGAR